MRTPLIILTTLLLPFSAFAEDYNCVFLKNDFGVTGFTEAKADSNGKYSLRLVMTVDGETDDGMVGMPTPAEVGNSQFEIGMFYTYYEAAHDGRAPVAIADVKSVKGMRFEENEAELEISYMIFRDANHAVLDQSLMINGNPMACKRLNNKRRIK